MQVLDLQDKETLCNKCPLTEKDNGVKKNQTKDKTDNTTRQNRVKHTKSFKNTEHIMEMIHLKKSTSFELAWLIKTDKESGQWGVGTQRQ